ncbi:MAG: hypothetical protein HY863_17670, partial [Chloroflexi bacterium]|nr:hypothetical protein [Chloroflexota bacterium]
TFRAHPGSAQLAIIAWHSPISGYVSVSGAVSDGDPGGGDGILWYIDRNSTNVASGGFSNGGLQTFASGINGAGLNTLAVVAGDTIYLAIHPNGNYYFDSTRVDIVISRTTAPTPTTIITYTPSRTPTVSRTPTKTQTPTRTLTPTSTATSTPTPQIRWHTGNRKPIAYGVRANISAPSQAPYLEHSGESNWVSLGVPHLWVQTGWRYYKWYDTSEKSYSAWSYIEYDDPVVGKQDDDMIIHNWGDTQEYRVEWSGTMWCVFIGNVYYGCFDTTALPPIEVQAISEVHISPLNELDVNFSEVYYKSLNNTWVLFNQAVWKEDAPYVVDKIHTYEYHNYGP